MVNLRSIKSALGVTQERVRRVYEALRSTGSSQEANSAVEPAVTPVSPELIEALRETFDTNPEGLLAVLAEMLTPDELATIVVAYSDPEDFWGELIDGEVATSYFTNMNEEGKLELERLCTLVQKDILATVKEVESETVATEYLQSLTPTDSKQPVNVPIAIRRILDEWGYRGPNEPATGVQAELFVRLMERERDYVPLLEMTADITEVVRKALEKGNLRNYTPKPEKPRQQPTSEHKPEQSEPAQGTEALGRLRKATADLAQNGLGGNEEVPPKVVQVPKQDSRAEAKRELQELVNGGADQNE